MEIKVKTGSSKNLVVNEGGKCTVYVKERAIEGKANMAVLKLLKKHFGRPVRIVKGFKSKKKIISL